MATTRHRSSPAITAFSPILNYGFESTAVYSVSKMENLLSASFDLLSSYDPLHIRKGLRCLEGFLAKMCLQVPSAPSKSGNKAANLPSIAVASRPKDAAFREFLRLQNGFEWNGTQALLAKRTNVLTVLVTIRLISCLERLLGRTNSATLQRSGHD